MMNIEPALQLFGIKSPYTAQLYGDGLINTTWKVTSGGQEYILQKVNDKVFANAADIAYNIKLVADHLKTHHPDYKFIAPVTALDGSEMISLQGNGFYRLFPFVNGSHSKNVVETPGQAYEAAAQFGKFTRLLAGLDTGRLKETIPHFHDPGFRYSQFLQALKNGDRDRITAAAGLIKKIKENSPIIEEYKKIRSDTSFKSRVTHHDTKISNVLFNSQDEALGVIDLDTVMPGYFISDVGDMIRTYVCPVSEEEKDFSKIIFRDEFYNAVVQGYYKEMKKEMSKTEKKYFFYAGSFMMFMQAMRFLTDHLNNDAYYSAKYEGHNFVRAGNQLKLLECYMKKKDRYSSIAQ